jgi:DNA-binding winged helix-turn-helix (wHTH) protein/tetratricopeptide (TPR) repeat protein
VESETSVLLLGEDGEWTLDLARRELRWNDQRIELRSKPFELLAFLATHRDRVLPKQEVLDAVWPDAVVSDTALSSALKTLRRTLGDDAARPGWIETRRGQGYRFVAPVRIEEVKGPTSTSSDPFLGRDGFLRWLEAKAEQAVQGRGQLAWVRGEAGMGKTRLLSEFADGAEEREVSVLWGRCLENGVGPPLWPWTQLLRGIDRASLPATAEWDTIWERIAEVRGGPVALPDAEKEPRVASGERVVEDRFALLESLARVLREAAERTPLLLLLDDVQWADDASLEALGLVAREIAGSRVLLVVALRDSASLSPALTKLLAESARLDHADRRALPPLSDEHVRALARSRVGVALPERKIDEIVERASGSPFFVRELVRMLVLQPAEADAAANVPEGVTEVVRVRLSGLGQEARAALEMAAIIGQSVPVALLERALGSKPAPLAQALEELLGAGFLREVRDGLAFEHDLIREAVQAELPRDRAVALHLRVGECLEEVGEVDEPGDLARHFGAAESQDAVLRAASYDQRAGRRAYRLLAIESAVEHFRRALSALDRVSEPAPALRTALLLDLGSAYQALGQVAPARSTFLKAAELARSRADVASLREAALGPEILVPSIAGLWSQTGDPEVESLLEEALRVGPAVSDGPALHIQARLAAALLGRGAQVERARSLLRDAEAGAEALGEPGTLGSVLLCRHLVSADTPPAERLDLTRRLASLGDEAHFPGLRAIGMVPEFGILSELGDPDAGRATDRLASWEAAQRLRWVRRSVAMQRAVSAFQAGDLERAENAVTEEMATAARLKEPIQAIRLASLLAGIRREQGRMREMLSMFRLQASQAPRLALVQLALAHALVEEGLHEEARQAFDAKNEASGDAFPVVLAWQIELAHHFEDGERARELLAATQALLGLHAVSMSTALYLGPVSRYAGLAAQTANDLDAAESFLNDAVKESEQANTPLWLAHARLDLARVELEQSGKGSPTILARLDDVVAFAERRGLEPLHRGAETTRDEARGAIPIRRRGRTA